MSDPTIRRRGLRERIEKTRHRYWGKGGQVNVPELTDQILGYLHAQGVQVAGDDWEPRPLELASAAAPDVAALLARCDALDAKDRGVTWIDVVEVRALLGVDQANEAETSA